MDARPNVLNKILPCLKTRDIPLTHSNAVLGAIEQIKGYLFEAATPKNAFYSTHIPNDIKTGSDVEIIMLGCIATTNDSGVDKYVRLGRGWSYMRAGIVIPDYIDEDGILVTIPNGELMKTVHSVSLLTISGLQANDLLGMRFERDADHVEDDYADYWFVGMSCILQYTMDKIGIV